MAARREKSTRTRSTKATQSKVRSRTSGFNIGIPPLPIPGDQNRKTGGFGGSRAKEAIARTEALLKRKEGRVASLRERKKAAGTVERQATKRAAKRTAKGRDATKATRRAVEAGSIKSRVKRKVKKVQNTVNRIRRGLDLIKRGGR